jgi:hypothetical protein
MGTSGTSGGPDEISAERLKPTLSKACSAAALELLLKRRSDG